MEITRSLLVLAVFLGVMLHNCYTDTLSKNDIYVRRERVTSNTAGRYCHIKNMKLLSIQTPEKNEQIAKLLKELGIKTNTVLWTSGQKFKKDNYWTWFNGDEVTNFSWGKGEPNAAGGDSGECIAVSFKNNKSLWDDRSCGEEHGYICEKFTSRDYIKQ